MRTYNIPKLERIIKRYKLLRQKEPDKHLDNCVRQPNLKDAIFVAANAIDSNNKINDHQKRIGREKLNAFAKKLATKESNISNAQNFDQIIDLVSNIKSEKIGELAIYDTAFRIGCFLNKFPEKVYLHSGTRVGARNLIGRLNGKKYLLPNELPSPFHNGDLPASDIEDILCIYKKEFAACVISGR